MICFRDSRRSWGKHLIRIMSEMIKFPKEFDHLCHLRIKYFWRISVFHWFFDISRWFAEISARGLRNKGFTLYAIWYLILVPRLISKFDVDGSNPDQIGSNFDGSQLIDQISIFDIWYIKFGSNIFDIKFLNLMDQNPFDPLPAPNISNC